MFPPPDPNGAVGVDHYFQAINLVFRIFDKDGNTVLGPLPTASLWSDLGGICATGSARTPLVRFDVLAARWVVAQSAFDPSDASVHACIAVSTTNDPTGAYQQYDFPLAAGSTATSARISVWPDGYYLTVNQVNGFANAGFGIYAFDRQAMLGGEPVTFVYANPGATLPETLWGLPADLDGSQSPPPGSPNVSTALGHPAIDGSPAPVLHTWRFHADFESPLNSTLEGPFDVPIDDFSSLECGTPTEGCVPQLDSTQLLQATPNRLMYRMPYRRFEDHESLVTTFTVDAGDGQAAVRWLELRDPAGDPFVFQQNTFAPDASHRFVGSIAMDRVGNIALGYSKSDATIHPSLSVTGRLVADPPSHMGSEDTFFQGPNSQPPVVGLWGRYSSMSIDPADDCRFWFTSEYVGEPAPFFEYTRVAAFQFPSCSDTFPGTLEGTVTDAESGLPVAGAKVTAGFSDTVTDDAGLYRFVLPMGTYDMTVVKFGWIPGSASGVVVNFDETTTQDFVITPAPQTLLNGVVRDGSGAGWPLYARVRITGPPEFTPAERFTDPVTGYFGITLVTGVTYTLSTESIVPGYAPDVRNLLVETAAAHTPRGIVEIIELTIDATACNAPGYALDAEGLSERFDSGTLPPGWNVVNNGGGLGWTIHEGADPCGLFDGNQTGGVGPFALVNSHCEGEVSEDTELVTPSVDLSALSSVQIRFDQDFNGGSPAFGEIADVDVSTDGGVSWTNVLHQTVAVAGPNTQSIDVTALAAGQADVRARFHYFNAFAALWWQVDDVILGQTQCLPLEGGLVVGNVFDGNTGLGLNGATVSDAPGGGSTTTFGTPDDVAQVEGFYVLFAKSGLRTLTAGLELYGSASKNQTVVPNATQRVDFILQAGLLQAIPQPLIVRVDPGGIETRILDMQNTGARAAGFDIAELDAPPVALEGLRGPVVDPDRAAALRARASSPALRNGRTARGLAPLEAPRAPSLSGGNVIANYATNLTDGWGVAFNTDAGDFWIANSALFAGDDLDYRYLTDGTQTGDT
ncbi:MAG: carboxypeptidase regulatory-like domain-containing protein, partial [Thermoanaerobaculia bacterium]